MKKLYALIMSGGEGTRFWPESTKERPKQYLKILGEKSLLESTLGRLDGLVNPNERFVVTVQSQVHLVRESSTQKMGTDNIIMEPSGRNTAPCILLAVASLLKKGASEDDIIAVLPSDHVILNESGFRSVLRKASECASEFKKIVTIGINPTFPHTGYGYIERAETKVNSGFLVSAFKEKPNIETASEYIKTGRYYWNAGMFVAPIKVFLSEFEKHAPEIFSKFDQLKTCIGDFEKTKAVYETIKKDSIDFAVMEKSKHVAVVPACGEFDWNDLGSWDALESVINSNRCDGNTVVKAAEIRALNSNNNIVYTPGKICALINVNDLVVVSNDAAVLIMPKNASQEVKKLC